MYMCNPKTGVYQPKKKEQEGKKVKEKLLTYKDVRDRELKNYTKCGGTDYLSWIISDRSPFKVKVEYVNVCFREF